MCCGGLRDILVESETVLGGGVGGGEICSVGGRTLMLFITSCMTLCERKIKFYGRIKAQQ